MNISDVHEDWPCRETSPTASRRGNPHADPDRECGTRAARHPRRQRCTRALDTPINTSTTSDPDKLKKLDAAIPVRRLAEPDDIAEMVVFLASGKSS